MNMQSKYEQLRTAQAGMSLIEVLVTLVLISVGLLGVAALQLTTLKSNQEAYVRSQASVLADYMLDRIRANQAGFRAGEYDNIIPNGMGTTGTTSGRDLTRWQDEIDRLMPGDAATSGGSIQRGAGNIVVITIRWGERTDTDLRDLTGVAQFQTRTEI